MMHDMMPEMMVGMGIVWVLGIVVLVHAAAALVKYTRS